MAHLQLLARILNFGLALALLVITAFVELFGVMVVAGKLPANWGQWGQLGFVFVALPASFLIAVALHEVGHLLAGAAVGFRPLLAHVGPLTLRPVRGSWRLVWDRHQSWLLARALVANQPAGRGRMLALALGGCTANLVGSVACVALALCLPSLGQSLAALVALNSLVTGLANLAPVRLLGYDSDGLCVLRLLCQRDVRPCNWQPWPSVL